jgi:hypothetical protein
MDAIGQRPAGWRFTLPPGWSDVPGEGEPGVAVYAPPGSVLRLHVLTERRPFAGGRAGGLAVLRGWAVTFLRPDDRRVADRELIAAGAGGWFAAANLRDGRATHCLWFLGWVEDKSVAAVMLALAFDDVGEADSAALADLDAALRRFAA